MVILRSLTVSHFTSTRDPLRAIIELVARSTGQRECCVFSICVDLHFICCSPFVFHHLLYLISKRRQNETAFNAPRPHPSSHIPSLSVSLSQSLFVYISMTNVCRQWKQLGAKHSILFGNMII